MEIRRSYDRLISTMGFPIPVRRHLYIESGPWSLWRVKCNTGTTVIGVLLYASLQTLYEGNPLVTAPPVTGEFPKHRDSSHPDDLAQGGDISQG